MENFIEDYLATVTSDPQTAWDELTPEFQAAERQLRAVQEVLERLSRRADLIVVRGRPGHDDDQLHRRVPPPGRRARSTDDVTLQLEGTDGNFLIAGES